MQNSAFRQNADTTKQILKTQAALSVEDKKAFECRAGTPNELEIDLICVSEVVSSRPSKRLRDEHLQRGNGISPVSRLNFLFKELGDMSRNPFFLLSCLVLFTLVPALETKSQNPLSPKVVVPASQVPARIAGRTNLYCAGYIRYQRFSRSPEIVGAESEPEHRTFAEGDIVFLNWGAEQGIKEGQQLQIIRPKGDVK